jgi:hypothetical protein
MSSVLFCSSIMLSCIFLCFLFSYDVIVMSSFLFSSFSCMFLYYVLPSFPFFFFYSLSFSCSPTLLPYPTLLLPPTLPPYLTSPHDYQCSNHHNHYTAPCHPGQASHRPVSALYHLSPHHFRLTACTPTITAKPNSTSPNVITMTFYLLSCEINA